MSQKEIANHIAPPETIWLFEQADDRWMSWSGTEDDLKEFIEGSGIKAYEYTLSGKSLGE